QRARLVRQRDEEGDDQDPPEGEEVRDVPELLQQYPRPATLAAATATLSLSPMFPLCRGLGHGPRLPQGEPRWRRSTPGVRSPPVMRRTATVLLLATLGGAASTDPGRGSTALDSLRDQARVALKPCGHCHDSTQASAMKSALRWFDLDQREWATALDASSLGCMKERMGDLKVAETDRGRVETYLAAEWARRDALPPDVGNRERAP